MSGGFQSYFYVRKIICKGRNLLVEVMEPIGIVRDGEYVKESLTVLVRNDTAMFVFCNINTNINHSKSPFYYRFGAVIEPQVLFAVVNSF